MRRMRFVLVASLLLSVPAAASADTADGEKRILDEMAAAIPRDRVVAVDDLHRKWQEVQAGTSQAVLLDIRTHDEFDTGHILGSSNVDSGHAYAVPKTWSDPETEIWVFCRTQHRATYFVGNLYRYGYRNVYLVQGGIAGWAEKGYPLFNEYLGEIKVVKYSKRLKEEYAMREGH